MDGAKKKKRFSHTHRQVNASNNKRMKSRRRGKTFTKDKVFRIRFDIDLLINRGKQFTVLCPAAAAAAVVMVVVLSISAI